jgi:hypothetical protein
MAAPKFPQITQEAEAWSSPAPPSSHSKTLQKSQGGQTHAPPPPSETLPKKLSEQPCSGLLKGASKETQRETEPFESAQVIMINPTEKTLGAAVLRAAEGSLRGNSVGSSTVQASQGNYDASLGNYDMPA